MSEKPKHDGYLDENEHYKVGHAVYGSLVTLTDSVVCIRLSLLEARSLLAWLEQERDAGRLEPEEDTQYK